MYAAAVFLMLNGMSAHIARATDSLQGIHRIKADLLPYHALFLGRKQVRAAIEYQYLGAGRSSFSMHIDAGMYDDYTFFKYYDFFNQDQGLHYHRQDIRIYGFHLMPAWNFLPGKPAASRRVRFFMGMAADISCYEKKLRFYNSLTEDRYRSTDRQVRFGAGPHLGITCRLRKKVHVELKATCAGKLLTLRSDASMKSILPFKAVWFDNGQHIWLIPQLSLCYDLGDRR